MKLGDAIYYPTTGYTYTIVNCETYQGINKIYDTPELWWGEREGGMGWVFLTSLAPYATNTKTKHKGFSAFVRKLDQASVA